MPSVLVIDDEEEVRDSLRHVLGRAGYEVTLADNGLTGVDMFFDRPADVVIVDIIMPRSNGVEVIKKIRSSFPGARILAISGGGNFSPSYKPGAITTESYLAAATQSGADAVISKPFHRSELLSLVRGLVKN
jgi:DNA-binding response OmpR family regulator